MRPATLSSNDYSNYYPSYSYNGSSPKTTSSQRNFGYSYNSPKTDSQKNFTYATKLRNENPRYVAKSERVAESPSEKRNAKLRESSASRMQTFSSTYSGFYNPDKDNDDKRDAYDGYRSRENFGNSTSTRNISASPLSRSVFLKDATREDSNILSRKKYEIDNMSSSVVRMPTESRPFSTKNVETREEYEDLNPKKGTVTYYPLDEFISRYSTQKSTVPSQNSRVNTQNSDAYSRSLTLSRIMANAPTRPSSTNLRGSAFFDSSSSPQNSGLNSSKLNTTYAERQNNETPNRFQKLLTNVPNFEYKKLDTRENDNYSPSNDRPVLTRSEFNFRKTYNRNDEVDSKPPSYRGGVDSKDRPTTTSNASKSEEKLSLDSFVTKVERGAMFKPTYHYEEKTDYKAGATRSNYGASYNDDERDRGTYSNTSSNLRASQTFYNNRDSSNNSKFFNSYDRNPEEPSTYAQEAAKWTATKSTRPSSVRNDDSTDGSQDDDEYGRSSHNYYMSNLEKYLKRHDDRDYFCQIYKEHFQQSFQSMKFCRYMKQTDPKVLAKKKVYLTKKEAYRNKKTLIFDLDETLIHCNDSPIKRSDVKLPIRFPHGETIEAGINVRPYALDILKELSQHFEIIVFTASHKSYATVVLDYLDPHKQYIQHRLFRDSCVYTDEGVYVKDLRVIANRNLQDMILVDNAAYSYGFQVDNGVPIIPFYENKSDTELKDLIPFLKSLAKVKDVRDVIKKTFKSHLYSRYDSVESAKEEVVFRK